jgi:hypothetical protein
MTDYRLTQGAVEQWASIIPPQMQATQLAIECWGSVSTVTVQMVATQAGLEMWASVALVSAARAGPRQSLVM